MESAQQPPETEERVLPYPFWVGLASHVTPDVLSQLLQTTRAARTAVVQAAAAATLTMRLSSPPAPDTLSLLRTSCRTLPARIVIINDVQQFSAGGASHFARLLIPRLSCTAVTSLSLHTGATGKGWLMDAGLLQDIHASLPGLKELDLKGLSTPARPYIYPANTSVGLATVRVHIMTDQPAAGVAALLMALGVCPGGSVTHLTLHREFTDMIARDTAVDKHVCTALRPVLLCGNPLHALRKLQLPNTTVDIRDEIVMHGLIHNAPALEHLQLHEVESWSHAHASTCVPWRILEVVYLEIGGWCGLPLGTSPDKPPLIVRVTKGLLSSVDRDEATAAAAHLTSTAAGHRQVRLECTHKVYQASLFTSQYLDVLLRVLTLTRFGLSNLILDGIDTAADLEGLVQLTSLTITLDSFETPLDLDQVRVGLLALPQATKLEVKADLAAEMTAAQLWAGVDEELLAVLPPHVTDVCLCNGPTAEQVAKMCVAVSKVPHRRACPLRLCVPDVLDWLGVVSRMLRAKGIDKAGIVGVP